DAVHHIAPQLNAAQVEAAAALASGTRLSVIEGYAGAGKTALLQAAVQLRGQRPLLTVTPTLKAAQEARSAGSEACSLHKLLHAHGRSEERRVGKECTSRRTRWRRRTK